MELVYKSSPSLNHVEDCLSGDLPKNRPDASRTTTWNSNLGLTAISQRVFEGEFLQTGSFRSTPISPVSRERVSLFTASSS
jgi:hypothetical protein